MNTYTTNYGETVQSAPAAGQTLIVGSDNYGTIRSVESAVSPSGQRGYYVTAFGGETVWLYR